MTNDSSRWKTSCIQFVAGGAAGFLEVALMQPLDLVKTRLQLQVGPHKKNDPNYYTGIIDCFTKLHKQEGALSFWKGLLPPLIIETPTKSIRFSSFYFYKNLLSSSEKTNIPTYMASGFCAGLTESFLICPFEVVKVTQQANRGHISHIPSSWETAKSVIKEEGVFGKRGIYRGLGATLHRHSIFCTFYLGLFFPIREHLPHIGHPFGDTLITSLLGIATGSFACLFNAPFDVVKSRIQAPQAKAVKYRNTWQSVQTVLQEEGFGALYKGLFAKILRLGPGGAIMIIVFEFVNDSLSRIFL